ncbi:hypothetical protein XSR1_120077 [Xenorhabdus szentirmaii DSM 16338]|uniref:Uncharacterized protein n=1 Tax=Xenorhabdus szentirmaii DSM 16338 TaxID=1427518 RepID=W1IUQ5_9GAMM|nr:hypothetical protein XSR1_120077 [Xenorhabdus szentirmaii DSM 16338]
MCDILFNYFHFLVNFIVFSRNLKNLVKSITEIIDFVTCYLLLVTLLFFDILYRNIGKNKYFILIKAFCSFC